MRNGCRQVDRREPSGGTAGELNPVACLPRLTVLAVFVATGISTAEPPMRPERVTVRVLGLFAPSRAAVLREAFEQLPELKFIALDYPEAELTVEFFPGKAFPGAKPEQFVPRINERIRNVTRHTLGAAPRTGVSRDRLSVLVIPVAGCDCPGCNLAATEAIDKLEGVDRVTCSFKDGKLTARIDPSKVKREELEEALRKRQVTVLPAKPGT